MRVRRWGNSVGVVIPAEIARAERFRPGDLVQIKIARVPSHEGFGMARGAKPFEHFVEDVAGTGDSDL